MSSWNPERMPTELSSRHPCDVYGIDVYLTFDILQIYSEYLMDNVGIPVYILNWNIKAMSLDII